MTQLSLSDMQRRVLRRMMDTVASGTYITIPEMADIAPVEKGKREWARDPLRKLEGLGLVERTPKIIPPKTVTWRLTLDGLAAIVNAA